MKKLQLKIINPVPNIDLLSTCLITQGFQDPIWKKQIGFYFEETYSTFSKDFLNWHVHFPFWQKFGKAVFEKVYQDKRFVERIYSRHKKIGIKLYEISDQVLSLDIKELSDQQIFYLLNKILANFHNFCTWGIGPVVIDFENNYLSDWLEKKVVAQVKKYRIRKPPQELVSLLATPLELTFAQKEKIALLKLATKKEISKAEIEKHRRNYLWVNYGYTGTPVPSLANYQKRITKLKKGRKKSRQLLQELQTERRKIKLSQKKLSQQLHLDQKTKYLFKTARTFMFLKAYRWGIEFKAIYVYDLLFSELGKRLGFTKQQFHYMTPQEIIGLGQGEKVDKKEINRRIKTLFAYTYIRGKNNFYYGKKAKQLFKGNLYQEEIDKSVKQFPGMATFLGKVKGTVKIVNTPEEMDKVRKGDILVSIATNPSIVPAMSKAAAFVTDTGGITCHAAIVAREMKKPCIIGTKIATKVLKDGDKVMVDANKGIVKKI